jgi:hypothetical protein
MTVSGRREMVGADGYGGLNRGTRGLKARAAGRDRYGL